MGSEKRLDVGVLAVIAAFWFVICSAVRFNLAATSAELADHPVAVVIDAGHGGEDGGAVSVTGVLESGINLAVAQRLDQILALCGIRTVMIRTGDEAVSTEGDTVTERKVADLKRRVSLANAVEPAIVVSVHQNHFSERKYRGAQVFYAATDGSRELAQLTQELLRQALDKSNRREAKPASSVYLMDQLCHTGILVECGFLSNPQEEQLLQQAAYQKKIACTVGCALVQYLEKGDMEVEV